ncbi:MAG: VOC family protein [Candidatus Nanopelagicales bacterium]
MLSNYTPIATVPTADLDRARAFYEETLGLAGAVRELEGEGFLYTCGASGFLLYPSQFAGTNQATTMAFQVDDGGFDAEVARLRDAGVSFDTFEWEGVVWVDGVATMDGGKAVWFRDPDGNIINLMTMEG